MSENDEEIDRLILETAAKLVEDLQRFSFGIMLGFYVALHKELVNRLLANQAEEEREEHGSG